MRVPGADATRVFRNVVCLNESCGAENPVTYRYCMKCGTSLASALALEQAATPDSAAADDSGHAERPSPPADSRGVSST